MEEKDKIFFNDNAGDWQVPAQNIKIAEEVIERLGIRLGERVVDIGCGTGILYDLLTERDVVHYVGIDYAENMLQKFAERFPLATLVCGDFEKDVSHIQRDNDYCIIFNAVPHFEDLLSVFKNANKLLKSGGKLVIVHCRTREGLKAHHAKIGYTSNKKEPIPLDEEFMTLCKQTGFENVILEDEAYFYFEGIKL